MPALYSGPTAEFVLRNPEELLGNLTVGLARHGFDTTTDTTFSWQHEISDLQGACGELMSILPRARTWTILFEYVLPVVGQRIDCVLLAYDLIFVIEYKHGTSATARAALQQAQDYALNLADFHEESRGHLVIPFAVGNFSKPITLDITRCNAGAAMRAADLPRAIVSMFHDSSSTSSAIDPSQWEHSRYFPVPSIIEAASAIYREHTVKDLAYSRAGIDNLERTERAVVDAVRDARLRGVKKLIIVTGVPGAGKTLAGLNAVQAVTQELDLEKDQAAFLSGNGPLVAVLQAALTRNLTERRRGAARSLRSRVREIHRFIRDTYADARAPGDRLIVFDEAQRGWTAARNLDKFNRDVSEAEALLDIMGRHAGWAVVVALIGGGQEIHAGEAGLAAWGDALEKHQEWEVLTSPEAILGGASVAGSRLFRGDPPSDLVLVRAPHLHLAVSKRSYETEVTAAWVNAVLDSKQQEAYSLSRDGLPIYLTRDLDVARNWLRTNAMGQRRAGLIASSGAARLRAEGIEAPTFDFLRGIEYVKWFLEPSGDYRSSNQLEVAMSEFEMQGLEIDLAGLLWGGDLVFPEGQVVPRRLKGTKWMVVSGTGDPQASADDARTRIRNKYRVLLTRFRKAMIIFVPPGSTEDETRSPEDFDSVHEYLVGCGVHKIN